MRRFLAAPSGRSIQLRTFAILFSPECLVGQVVETLANEMNASVTQ